MTKPIHLYSHAGGPNPWKVAIILEELDIPYETEFVDFSVIKQEPYISVNPNGRVPSITDPNTNLTIFESGAIIEYLVETYDKENKLQYTTSPEKWLTKSWLHFQTSGQGPYFGQAAWFSFFHPEKGLTSAIERYQNEAKRVTLVIDAHLKKKGTQYLVGDRVTYADLAFLPWYQALGALSGGWDYKAEAPVFTEWLDKLNGREKVKKVFAEKARVSEKH